MYLLDNQQKLLQQKAIITAEKEKNKLQIFVFSFILFILIVSFIVLINNRRKTIKYNNKLKLLNQEINTKNDELDSALKSKDKFFSIIAHDLRNPFGSFMMLTKYLKEELQNLSLNEIQEYLTILSSSSDNLFKLLENLLEWSRVQRDLIEPHFGEFNVKQVVKMCVSFVEQQAQAKSQEISYDINEEITGFADSNLINTIIRNLLTNAIKFTPRGGKITIEALEKEDKVIVSVADTGTGMDSNTINKLFKIEEKIGTPGTEGEPSTGLGLVLCKEFIELNKGKIYVQSKLGEGSTFFIEFPKSK
jgi:signal transduction histidine kinase